MKKKNDSAKNFLFKNENGKIVPLDDINLDIIKRMLKDPTVTDSALSTRLDLSDDNISKRRTIVEDGFLKKHYLIDVSALGWHVGDIYIDVGKGKSEELAERVFSMFPNILEITLRIDSDATVFARIFYRDTNELAGIIEKIKHLPFVKDVAFSEIIKIVRSRSIGTMQDIFTPLEEGTISQTTESKQSQLYKAQQ